MSFGHATVAVIAGLLCAASARAEDSSPEPAETHTVTATPFTEEQRVGANRQPDWTTQHRFSEVEIYVLRPWELSAEAGWDAEVSDGEHEVAHSVRQEFEIGLPWRAQVDYVLHEQADPDHGFHVTGHSVEGSIALADWGKIPLNPALLAEWTFGVNAPNEIEGKVLLGDEITSRWHWGANLGVEQEFGGDDEREISASAAASYSVLDRVLGVGAEMKLAAESEEEIGANGKNEEEYEMLFTLGPSIQWRITSELHLDLAALFGLAGPTPLVDTFVALAYTWDLGDENEGAPSVEEQRLDPVSGKHY